MGHHRRAHEDRLQGDCRSKTLGQQGVLKRLAAGCALCAIACLATCGGGHAQSTRLTSPATPELWYYHHTYLSNDAAEQTSRALIDKAAAAGYTGLALWDSGLDYLGNDNWPPENEDRMRDVLRYAEKKRLKVIVAPAIFGYSNDVLEANPNWAESEAVVGQEFVVDVSGQRLQMHDSFAGVRNGNFESGKRDWFDTNDNGIGLSEAAHTGKGAAVVVDAPANARFRQSFAVVPHRQYHVRLFFKSANFRGGPMISVFGGNDTDKVYLNANIAANGTHDWTQLDYTFNSGVSSTAQMYFGVWGGCSGSLWFDDVTVEEAAFVYLTRRSGTPLKIYAAGHPETIYNEGADVNRIVDGRMNDPKAFADEYHATPAATLPKGTRLKPGDKVAIDYYAAQPIPGLHSISMCMTEPGMFQWIARNGKTIHHVLPKDGGLFLGYDEIRQANTCGSCRAKKMTAGELLAWSVGRTAEIYSKVAPGRPLYIWNDMFDPYHNARANYYYVDGDLDGSWKGIPSEVTVMNWNLEHLHKSMLWFAGLDGRQAVAYRQVIAGYYDSGNGAKSAADEVEAAHGVPGVQGLMYTTWADDYGQLKQFADGAKAGWAGYLASLR